MSRILLGAFIAWLTLLTILQVIAFIRHEKADYPSPGNFHDTANLPNYAEISSGFQSRWELHPRKTFSNLSENYSELEDRLWALESRIDRAEKMLYALGGGEGMTRARRGKLNARAELDPTDEIPLTDSPSTMAELAKLNQKWLDEFQKRNQGVFLYSLTPLQPKQAYYRAFEAIFFQAYGKRFAQSILYIRMNDTWQLNGKRLSDPLKVQSSDSPPRGN